MCPHRPLLLQLQPWVSRPWTISMIIWGRKKEVMTNKSLFAADHVKQFFLFAFLFESLHIINRSSSAPLAGNYYWIQNLITKIAFGQLFFSVQTCLTPRKSTSKKQTKTSWQKTMLPQRAADQKCAKPLEVDQKNAQSDLGKLLQQPPHNRAINKWIYNLSLLNAQAWKKQ